MRIVVDEEKLISACNQYGLDYRDAKYLTNVVVVPSRKSKIYVSFDKNCNTVGVEKFDTTPDNLYNYFEGSYQIFNDDVIEPVYFDDISIDKGLSLGCIVKISDKYKVVSRMYGNSNRIISDDGICDNLDVNKRQMLSYIYFLRTVLNKYFLLSYHMKSCNYSIPDATSYLQNIISDLESYVNTCIKMNSKPFAIDYIDLSGQKYLLLDSCSVLSDVLDLLLRSKGYKQSSTNVNEIEKIEDGNIFSLSDLLNELKEDISINSRKTGSSYIKKS